MTDHRGQTPEIRYGADYATVLVFRFWLDAPDAWSDPRQDPAGVVRTADGSAAYGISLGHEQMLRGTVRRIPRADIADGVRTLSGWPAWRAWLAEAWDLQSWRWVYAAGTYDAGDASTYFDAEL